MPEDHKHLHTRSHHQDANAQPTSDRRLAMFFAILAIALVPGYLLLSKLADMSQQEDCALAPQFLRWASEMPSRR